MKNIYPFLAFFLFLQSALVFADKADLKLSNEIQNQEMGEEKSDEEELPAIETKLSEKEKSGIGKVFLEGIKFLFNSEEESKLSSQDKMKINVENTFRIYKDEMIPKPYSWSIHKPETEIFLFYPLSKELSFKSKIDFLPKGKGWDYHIRKLLIYYKLPMSLNVQIGYFDYPVSYSSKNRLEFVKITLMDRVLFPLTKKAVGALLEGKLWKSFYWHVSWQGHTQKRSTDFVRLPGINPAFTASLIYKSKKQRAFLSYFQKNFSLRNPVESFGLGTELSLPMSFFKMDFRGELWRTERDQPYQEIASFYVFPSLRWNRFRMGALFGGAYHDLGNSQSRSLEYILKGSFYFTENIFFTVERIKEWDQLLRENYWSFYLTTEFDIL